MGRRVPRPAPGREPHRRRARVTPSASARPASSSRSRRSPPASPCSPRASASGRRHSQREQGLARTADLAYPGSSPRSRSRSPRRCCCASRGASSPPTLRLYRPRPTVGVRAARQAAARVRSTRLAAARERGFEPVLRSPGGHAAAYDAGTVGVRPRAAGGRASSRACRTASATTSDVDRRSALVALGVDARVGEVPGEYCRGAYTVNAGGRTKLVGTAQRAIRGGALLAGFVTVEGADAPARRARPGLRRARARRGIPRPSATSPALSIDAVEDALARQRSRPARRAVGARRRDARASPTVSSDATSP